ncbi:MAG: glutamine-hydrolyzing GMP synthase, partial [Thiotrichales bacterium]|nr:glutamine-hydrolyzing GMP synthase [Thiotrichales bacterium]
MSTGHSPLADHATDIHSDRILILDFGSQYTQLIARRVRECQVYSEIYAYDVSEEDIQAFNPSAIILSGGPESVTAINGIEAPPGIFSMGVPILGICYGMQTMAAQLGGTVEQSSKREFGYAEIRARGHSDLLKDIQDRNNDEGHGLLDVWMSHGDRVAELPEGFKVIASTDNAPIAGIADETRHFYGLQFHPEVTHTPQGMAILQRFVHDISGCENKWSTSEIIDEITHSVREQVGNDKVLLALSGGVDSSVVAALLHKAIGDQLTCVFVDNGLLRLNEADQVMDTFAEHMGIRVIKVDAQDRFMNALKGISDPEEKRK